MKYTKGNSRLLRVRSKLKAVSNRPRLMVYRSNLHIWAQVVDNTGKVLAAANSKTIKQGTKVEKSALVGETIGKELMKTKITQIVFDRAGYRYHGRVKALADGARKAGLEF